MADSDPNVLYVGMGGADLRGDVSHGDSVYKSTAGVKPGNIWDLQTHAISGACRVTHRI